MAELYYLFQFVDIFIQAKVFDLSMYSLTMKKLFEITSQYTSQLVPQQLTDKDIPITNTSYIKFKEQISEYDLSVYFKVLNMTLNNMVPIHDSTFYEKLISSNNDSINSILKISTIHNHVRHGSTSYDEFLKTSTLTNDVSFSIKFIEQLYYIYQNKENKVFYYNLLFNYFVVKNNISLDEKPAIVNNIVLEKINMIVVNTLNKVVFYSVPIFVTSFADKFS